MDYDVEGREERERIDEDPYYDEEVGIERIQEREEAKRISNPYENSIFPPLFACRFPALCGLPPKSCLYAAFI